MKPALEAGLRYLVIIAVFIAMVLTLVFRNHRNTAISTTPKKHSEGFIAIDSKDMLSNSVKTNKPATHGELFSRSLAWSIEAALGKLRVAEQGEPTRNVLQRLRSELRFSRPAGEAAMAIIKFLETGEDAKTGLGFRVGPEHSLLEAPTFRTALLDWLGAIDPARAGEYAQSIFTSRASPEEYAIALRNLAWGRPDARDELRAQFEALLANEDWSSRPSAGYLESFDVVPFLGDGALVAPLAGIMASSAQGSMRHASLMALDRLVMVNPSGALQEMLTSNELDKQPWARASFFARADLRDHRQRQLLERYLLDPELSEEELNRFVKLFPNANAFASHSLFTESTSRNLADLAAQDSASLDQLQKWKADSRFARLESHLDQIETRVRQHVESARRGGYLPRQ